MRVVGDIIDMLNTVGQGRSPDDAVVVMASAYRSYAHHHPGRYSAFTRMPRGASSMASVSTRLVSPPLAAE